MRSALTVLLVLGVLFGVAAQAEPSASLAELQRQSQQSLQAMEARLAVEEGDRAQRNQIVLLLAQVRDKQVSEAQLNWLAGYREAHPADVFAKLYEGYGWLLTADRYMQQQNYFRAAELAKRGFFLVDEAVDEQPDNWRLRLLRARMDSALPADFGRYVVALDDLRQLNADATVAQPLHALLEYLRVRALTMAGRDAEASEALAGLSGSPLAERATDQRGLFLTPAEIQHVLQAALESADE